MHTDRNLLIAGACLALVVGLTVALFIWPNYRQVAAAQNETAQLQGKIVLLEGQAQALHLLESQVAQTLEYIDIQLKMIPDSPDVASVIRKLSQDVDRVTVVDQTFTAGTPCDAIPSRSTGSGPAVSPARTGASRQRSAGPDQPTMQSMPLNVDMEASFDSLFALIRSAESLDRLVRITSVRAAISNTKVERPAGSPPLLKAAVGLEAIYRPPQDLTSDRSAGAAPQSRPPIPQITPAEGS